MQDFIQLKDKLGRTNHKCMQAKYQEKSTLSSSLQLSLSLMLCFVLSLRPAVFLLVFVLFFCILASGLSNQAYAQDQQSIPDLLKPWQNWVLKDNKHIKCPYINKQKFADVSSHICAWSGPLRLDVNDNGAQFSQAWQVLEESKIMLPGDNQYWPSSVSINGEAATLLESKGRPYIILQKGNYAIRGNFAWQNIPTRLPLGAQSTLISLSKNQSLVAFPRVENGMLLLNAATKDQTVQNAISISVARKISDGPYIEAQTFISLSVSGSTREEVIGKPLLQQFDLIDIESTLPAFLDGQGNLRVQLKAGEHEILISSYAKPNLTSWQRSERIEQWPSKEIWLVQTAEHLRNGKLEGAEFIDNEQAIMPEDWYELVSYLVPEKGGLQYIVSLRGKPQTTKNQLVLNREAWLGFDNKAIQFVDHIAGTMNSEWRLVMQAPYILQSAEDKDGPILITQTSTKNFGVENRYVKVAIEARGLVNKSDLSYVTAWQNEFDSVSIVLNMPPGTRLMHAAQVDYASNTWTNNWGIWSSFVILFSSIIAFRLMGPLFGVISVLTLLMIYQEAHSPIIYLVNVLLALSAQKHINFAKTKKLVSAYAVFSIVIAAIAVLYFSAVQIKSVVYPQLESSLHNSYDPNSDVQQVIMREADSFSKSRAPNSSSDAYEDIEMISVNGSRVATRPTIEEKYQADAVLQAGAGIPNWQWKSHRLTWDGPVVPEQEYGLFVLSKNQNRFFKVIGLGLLLSWFAMLVLAWHAKVLHAFGGSLPKSFVSTASALALITLVNITLPSKPAYAQDLSSSASMPSQQSLEELKAWLLSPPPCQANCASLHSANISSIDSQNINLQLIVHANVDLAMPLPSSRDWQITNVVVNNKGLENIASIKNKTYVWLKSGVNSIELIARIAPVGSWQLAFVDKPKIVSVADNQDWQVNGLNKGKLQGNELELVSLRTAERFSNIKKSNTAQNAEQSLNQASKYSTKPLVKVRRDIVFEQNWRVKTTVSRVSPASGSLNVKVPLIEGESLLSNELRTEANKVLINLSSQQQSVEFNSSLTPSSGLTLHADKNAPIVEHWTFLASPSNQINFTGVPEVFVLTNDYYIHHFYPYPGESLRLDISRPSAAEGSSLAFDSASLVLTQGKRNAKLELTLAYRSNSGSEHTIELPKDYVLDSVQLNNNNLNIQAQNNELSFPLQLGKQTLVINMSKAQSAAWLSKQPQFDLRAPTSNIYSKLQVSRDRWVIWTSGPVIGPAVLYWGELLVFIVLALVVSRISFSPLNTLSWVLLGLGLSMSNWSVLVLVVLWFGAIYAASKRSESMSHTTYNFIQVVLYLLSGLTVLTLVFTIPFALLSSPDMGIEGNAQAGGGLSWFADQSKGSLPIISVLSLPVLAYKGLMLIWVIWLCFALVNWLKWAWKLIGNGGYWRYKKRVKAPNNSKLGVTKDTSKENIN